MDNLKPCPFCGGQVIRKQFKGFGTLVTEIRVYCPSCKANMTISTEDYNVYSIGDRGYKPLSAEEVWNAPSR